MHRHEHLSTLCGLLACLALALLLFHSLAGGTLLSANAYDSYALQAENWLAGRNYIVQGENYPWLELAVYEGRYYQSFPPVPAVLLLPWVVLCGGAASVPSNLVIALVALLCAAGCYGCCARAGLSAPAAACLTLFVSLGSNAFWLSTSGGVWFMAQMLGLCLSFWGLFFAQRATPGHAALTSLCLALAVGCRPFYALLLVFWLVAYVRRDRVPGHLAAAVLPAALAAAAMMAYNLARFGDPLEFGHNYLPEYTRNGDALFSLAYLPGNLLQLLRPVTLDAQLQLHFPVFNGFCFLVADPLFLLAILRALGVVLHREPRPSSALNTGGWHLLAGCLAVAVLLCLHRTLGGWQFGARYLVDLFPWVILWFCTRPGWQPRAGAWTLCGMAILFNLYGALYMLQT